MEEDIGRFRGVVGEHMEKDVFGECADGNKEMLRGQSGGKEVSDQVNGPSNCGARGQGEMLVEPK